jgi:hypothetical protein
MRQIESEMLYAVCNRKNMSKDNTQVQVREDGSIWVRLHGNLIAHRGDSGLWQFTLAGWNTPTTRSRLRALGIDIRQRGGVPYYNGQPISIREVYCAY